MEMINEGALIARHEAARGAVPRAGEYLTYRVGAEDYGVDIQVVREIRCYEAPTRLPGAPAFVRGVVNLRGVIVPVVDLRLRLGSASADCTPATVVIVLTVRERVVGAVVDAVSGVMDIAQDAIRQRPELEGADCDYITGIAGDGDRMLMLVDMACLLGPALGQMGELA